MEGPRQLISPFVDVMWSFISATGNPMLDHHRRSVAFISFLTLFAFLATSPDTALAQSSSGAVPANAHAKSYGSGWECDQGFHENSGSCEAVILPANAFPTGNSYDRGWDCSHGFQERDNTCVIVTVPAHAYLDASGGWWACNRGYREGRKGL
jgi:hypothetical protein